MTPVVIFVLVALIIIAIVIVAVFMIDIRKEKSRDNLLLKRARKAKRTYVATQQDRCAELLSKPDVESLKYAEEKSLYFIRKEMLQLLSINEEDWGLLQTVVIRQGGVCTSTQMENLLKFSSFLSIEPEKIILRGNVPVSTVDKKYTVTPTATMIMGSGGGYGFGFGVSRAAEYDFNIARGEEVREQFTGRYVVELKNPPFGMLLHNSYGTLNELCTENREERAEKLFTLIKEVSKSEKVQWCFRDEVNPEYVDKIYASIEENDLFSQDIGIDLTTIYMYFYALNINRKLDEIYPERKRERH